MTGAQLELRKIGEDEVFAWEQAVRTGFLERPAAELPEWRRATLDLERTWAVVDAGRFVATYRSFPTELTLPGGALAPVSAVTNVTVSPTHRRRGLLTRMIEADLREACERGEVASILIAAEWPIYGRFGFGPAIESVEWSVDARAARFVQPGAGEVEIVDGGEARRELPELHERRRHRQAGQIPIEDWRWDLITGLASFPGEKPKERWFARCRVDGGTAGYALYRLQDRWSHSRPDYQLELDHLVGDSPAVEARLWRFCCEMDWVSQVVARNRPVDEPIQHLLADGRAARRAEHADYFWLRPLDVPRYLSTRRYATQGSVVLEITDPLGYAGGRFALETGPDGCSCRATRTSPDLAVPASALGIVSLGGIGLVQLARSGQVEELTPGALLRAAAMFAWPEAPWCAIGF